MNSLSTLFKTAAISIAVILSVPLQAQEDNTAKKAPVVYTSLKKALRNAEEVERLDLGNQELKEFPEDIFKLKNLKVLHLDSNQVTSIPARISELKELKVLDISNNQITELPASIGELPNLHYLYAERNAIKTLPKTIGKLTGLIDLFLSHNEITEIPEEIKNMQELERLVISHNRITTIPDNIGHAYSIEVLSINHNTITELPKHFYELKRLKYLYISNNKISSIDPAVANLTELVTFSAENNELKKLPEEMGALVNVEYLYLDANKLDSLPKRLNELFKLKELFIGENQITSIPAGYGELGKLEKIDIKDLILKPVPQALYDLQNNGTKILHEKSKELYQAKLTFSQAKNKRLTENYDAAAKLYEDLIRVDTNHALAMSEYAAMLIEMDQFDKAEAICKRAMTKNNSKSLQDELKATYYNCLNKTKKIDQVIAAYQEKINSKPTDAAPQFELGMFYYDQLNYVAAKKAFLEAVKKDPAHSNSHFYLALTLLNEDNQELFVLPALRMILLDPEGKRAKTTFPFVLKNLDVSTGIKSKNGGTSYHDSYIIRNEEGRIVYKSESPQSDLLAAMLADILKTDKKGDDSTTAQIKKLLFNTDKSNKDILKDKLTKLVTDTALVKKPEDQYIADYYLKFIKDLGESPHFDTFANLFLSYRGDEKMYDEWVKANAVAVTQFNDWLKNYKWPKDK